MRISDSSSDVCSSDLILSIYQECRTPEEIDTAFRKLQEEMDEGIRTRMDDTRQKLFEHFDEDVHQRLRLQLADAKAQLDRVGQRFWFLTRFMQIGRASCRERVCQYGVDLGGGRSIKKKTRKNMEGE